MSDTTKLSSITKKRFAAISVMLVILLLLSGCSTNNNHNTEVKDNNTNTITVEGKTTTRTYNDDKSIAIVTITNNVADSKVHAYIIGAMKQDGYTLTAVHTMQYETTNIDPQPTKVNFYFEKSPAKTDSDA